MYDENLVPRGIHSIAIKLFYLLLTIICVIANFPWLLPIIRFFGRQSSFGLSWRFMEATTKKIVSERRSRGIGGKVTCCHSNSYCYPDSTVYHKPPFFCVCKYL